MFGFFRKKKAPADTSPASITAGVLSTMGFALTENGVGIVVLSNMSGYSPHETASVVALMTIARDVKEAGNDVMQRMKIATHSTEVIKMLHQFTSHGLIREDLYSNDVNAIKNIAYMEKQNDEWVERVLSSDPIAGKERLARRTVAV